MAQVNRSESVATGLERLAEELRQFRLALATVMHRADYNPEAQSFMVADRLRDIHSMSLVMREALYDMAGNLRATAGASQPGERSERA